jgi:malonate-semialdehyde dehydrogenase (acetylating)/methylmalonate-semialdehyde dehydrogenase
MKYPPVQNYIDGQFAPASMDKVLEVISPLDGTFLSTVPLSVSADLDAAVRAAKAAFPAWSRTPIKDRVQVFFRYKHLLEKNIKSLSELISEENGKTIGEAIAEVEKCIELAEFATSLPQLVTGEVLEVSRGVECRTEHVPLGVVASIVSIQFSCDGSQLDHPKCYCTRKLHGVEAIRKSSFVNGVCCESLKEAGLPGGVY